MPLESRGFGIAIYVWEIVFRIPFEHFQAEVQRREKIKMTSRLPAEATYEHYVPVSTFFFKGTVDKSSGR